MEYWITDPQGAQTRLTGDAAMVPAIFLRRPNRFIAEVAVDGQPVITHVKNTGRCRELLVPGATVYLLPAQNPARKTPFDLITVKKGSRLINMDSQAPNRVFLEYLQAGRYVDPISCIKPEITYGSSRFDFYMESQTRKIFIEVKGVTLEGDGVVRFPDAPTQRGVKHLRGLSASLQHGYEAHVVFIIQMDGVRYFTPNDETHPAFGEALREAKHAGVTVTALACEVTPGSISIASDVPIRL